MDIQEQLKGIKPLKGHLLPLRTVQETHPVEETGEALVAEIDIKSADKVVKLLTAKFPRDPALSIAHLRRFAKPKELPGYLKRKFPQWATLEGRALYILVPPRLPEHSELETLLSPFAPVSPPSAASPSTYPPDEANEPSTIHIESAQIPLLPPTSQEQAQKWCEALWPTHYNPSARPASQYPPPMLLNRTMTSMEPQAGTYLSIAKYVAREAQNSGRGRDVGVVVVDAAIAADNPKDPLAAIVAVAGDARYYDGDVANGGEMNVESSPLDQRKTYNPDAEGRPDHHALMRGVSMISHKRFCSSSTSSYPSSPSHSLIPPPSPLESHILTTSQLLPSSNGGYLCTSLDIYSTHEPCMCCAMGMLLSRFRAVIIPAKRCGRNRADAALRAEIGYGLHWRAELNWRAMGFEFVEENEESADEAENDEFHA